MRNEEGHCVAAELMNGVHALGGLEEAMHLWEFWQESNPHCISLRMVSSVVNKLSSAWAWEIKKLCPEESHHSHGEDFEWLSDCTSGLDLFNRELSITSSWLIVAGHGFLNLQRSTRFGCESDICSLRGIEATDLKIVEIRKLVKSFSCQTTVWRLTAIGSY